MSRRRAPLPLWPVRYCLVPVDLDKEAFLKVRRALRRTSGIEVVRERRGAERRNAPDRREGVGGPEAAERRSVRNPAGRRVGDRRSQVLAIDPGDLPVVVRPYAELLVFVERLEPAEPHREDVDTERLVLRFQAGDAEAFTALYMRYFDRIYSYLCVVLRNEHAAEDATQEVFARALRALPRYERRSIPWRAWLFRIARNHALDQMRAGGKVELMAEVEESPGYVVPTDEALEQDTGWLADRDLAVFVERLPLAQRQALVLRFMLDLPANEVGAIMERSSEDVRALQSRALRYLRERLVVVRDQRGRRTSADARRHVAPSPVLAERKLPV